MKLLRLQLTNFKGARDVVIDPDGADLNVYGDNATGKTTLVDALSWLLFGKDSSGSAKFDIKTRGRDGEPLKGLNHTVSGKFLTDSGKTIEFTRTYREVYTQTKGTATKKFGGHTTDYFVDGVPLGTESEYLAAVASICKMDVFRLLTDPTFFCDALEWKKRREMLLDLIGDLTDQDVIDSNPDLKTLPQILEGRTIEGYRKIIVSRMKSINEELEAIPHRLDEAHRAIMELPAKPEKSTVDLGKQIAEIETRKAEARSGGEIARRQVRITEIQGEIQALTNEVARTNQDATAELRSDISKMVLKGSEIQNEITKKRAQVETAQTLISDKNKDLVVLTQSIEKLRAEGLAILGRTFEWDDSQETCQTCGQALPAESVEARKEIALGGFNAKKSEDLEANKAKGMETAGKIEAAKTYISEMEQKVEAAKTLIASLEAEYDALESVRKAKSDHLNELVNAQPDVSTHPKYFELVNERKALEEATAEERQNIDGTLAELERQATELRLELAKVNSYESTITLNESTEKRIQELEQRQKDLAAEFEVLKSHEHLTNVFIRSKVRLLTSKINARFQMASFQLFEEQVNGGLAECCEATYQGVPYKSLNHAAKINVGLDIIQTLGEHIGFQPPIMIDGAESVTQVFPTDAQQIRFIVSAPDKKLRIEPCPGKERALAGAAL